MNALIIIEMWLFNNPIEHRFNRFPMIIIKHCAIYIRVSPYRSVDKAPLQFLCIRFPAPTGAVDCQCKVMVDDFGMCIHPTNKYIHIQCFLSGYPGYEYKLASEIYDKVQRLIVYIFKV